MANEVEVVKQKKVKRKHYWWRYLLCMFFGSFLTVSTVVGGIAYVAFIPQTSQLINLVGQDPSKIITEEYGKKTIFDTVMDIVNGKVDVNSLGGISSITPLVDTAYDQVIAALQGSLPGLTLDKETLFTTGFGQMGAYLQTYLMNDVKLDTLLGSVLNNAETDAATKKILNFLVYAKDESGNIDTTKPRSINDLMTGLSAVLDTATLNDFIDVGTEGILFELKDIKIMNFGNEINNIKINKLVNVTETSPKALKFLGEFTIGNVTTALDTATIGDVLDVGDSYVLNNLKDIRLNDFATTIPTLTINKFIDIKDTDPKALQFFGTKTLTGVGDAFSTATLDDLVNVGTEGILYNLRSYQINNLSTAIKDLPLNQIINIDPATDYPALVYLGNYKQADFSTALENATLGQLIKINPTDTIIYGLKDKKISELEAGVKALKISDVVTINETSPEILKTFKAKGTTIDGIQAAIEGITLGEAIKIDPNTSSTVMIALKDTPITGLDGAIKTMTFETLLGITDQSSLMLKAIRGATLDTIDTTVAGLTLGNVINIDTTATSQDPLILRNLASTKINELSTQIKTMPMSSFIDISATSPAILQAIKNSTLSSIEGDINGLTLGDAISIDANSPAVLQALKATPITEVGTKINTLTMADLLGIDPTSPDTSKVLKAISSATLSTLNSTVSALTIGDVVNTSGNRILTALANQKVTDLGSAIGNLKIGELIDTTTNPSNILTALANTTINELPTKIQTLTVTDVLGDTSGNKFLKNLGAENINNIGTAMLNLKFVDVFEDDIFVNTTTKDTFKSTWKYLLTESDETFDSTATGKKGLQYTLNTGMNQMISNMTNNMSRATLQTLYDDGLITITDPTILNKKIGGVGPTIGSMTMASLISAISYIAS